VRRLQDDGCRDVSPIRKWTAISQLISFRCRINVVEHPEIAEKHNAPWTPTILFHDASKKEHRRTEGYMDPRRMLEEMALARMKAAIDRSDFDTAKTLAPEVIRFTNGERRASPRRSIGWQ